MEIDSSRVEDDSFGAKGSLDSFNDEVEQPEEADSLEMDKTYEANSEEESSDDDDDDNDDDNDETFELRQRRYKAESKRDPAETIRSSIGLLEERRRYEWLAIFEHVQLGLPDTFVEADPNRPKLSTLDDVRNGFRRLADELDESGSTDGGDELFVSAMQVLEAFVADLRVVYCHLIWTVTEYMEMLELVIDRFVSSLPKKFLVTYAGTSSTVSVQSHFWSACQRHESPRMEEWMAYLGRRDTVPVARASQPFPYEPSGFAGSWMFCSVLLFFRLIACSPFAVKNCLFPNFCTSDLEQALRSPHRDDLVHKMMAFLGRYTNERTRVDITTFAIRHLRKLLKRVVDEFRRNDSNGQRTADNLCLANEFFDWIDLNSLVAGEVHSANPVDRLDSLSNFEPHQLVAILYAMIELALSGDAAFDNVWANDCLNYYGDYAELLRPASLGFDELRFEYLHVYQSFELRIYRVRYASGTFQSNCAFIDRNPGETSTPKSTKTEKSSRRSTRSRSSVTNGSNQRKAKLTSSGSQPSLDNIQLNSDLTEMFTNHRRLVGCDCATEPLAEDSNWEEFFQKQLDIVGDIEVNSACSVIVPNHGAYDQMDCCQLVAWDSTSLTALINHLQRSAAEPELNEELIRVLEQLLADYSKTELLLSVEQFGARQRFFERSRNKVLPYISTTRSTARKRSLSNKDNNSLKLTSAQKLKRSRSSTLKKLHAARTKVASATDDTLSDSSFEPNRKKLKSQLPDLRSPTSVKARRGATTIGKGNFPKRTPVSRVSTASQPRPVSADASQRFKQMLMYNRKLGATQVTTPATTSALATSAVRPAVTPVARPTALSTATPQPLQTPPRPTPRPIHQGMFRFRNDFLTNTHMRLLSSKPNKTDVDDKTDGSTRATAVSSSSIWSTNKALPNPNVVLPGSTSTQSNSAQGEHSQPVVVAASDGLISVRSDLPQTSTETLTSVSAEPGSVPPATQNENYSQSENADSGNSGPLNTSESPAMLSQPVPGSCSSLSNGHSSQAETADSVVASVITKLKREMKRLEPELNGFRKSTPFSSTTVPQVNSRR